MQIFKLIIKLFLLAIVALLTTFFVLGSFFLYAYKIEPEWIEIKDQPVYIKGLPNSFEGFRIVQLSDFHGRHFDDNQLANKVNSLKPDLIAITGDVFDDDRGIPLNYADTVLGGLKARYGSFFIFGNNDYYLNSEDIIRRMTALGINTLVNQSWSISLKGQAIWILGITGQNNGRINIPKAMKNTGQGTKILLAHSPEIINDAARLGIDLALVGHTHGGQIRIPYVPRVITFVKRGFEKYVSGLYKVGNTQMYVNRGLGLTKIPMRFLARPEITVFTLHRLK